MTVTSPPQGHARQRIGWKRHLRPAGLIAASAAALLVAVTVSGSSAHAEPSSELSDLRWSNEFFAYAEAGESLDIAFSSSERNALAVTVEVNGPGGEHDSCTVPAGAATGSNCTFDDLSSSTPGIWTVDYQRPGSTGNQTSVWTWSIGVRDGASALPGRVWSDSFAGFNDQGADFSLWYVGPDGNGYRADYRNYLGIDSIFRANQFGNVEAGTCRSAYRSFGSLGADAASGAGLAVSGEECGVFYHIFFDEPAVDLPERAALPNGTDTFILPSVQAPVATDFTFTPDAADGRAGSFTFTAQDAIGNGQILIDGNGDGDYDDPEDRALAAPIPTNGKHTVTWDGLDGQGNPVAPNTAFTARLALAQAGEIHFVNTDVETRSGLSVTAFRGTDTGERTLYWNDVDLPIASRICDTPVRDGTSGVDSNGGVHGWDCFENANNGVNGSWGDARNIDDWTFQRSTFSIDLAVPVSVANYTVVKSSTPAPGSSVAPGQTINYTITVRQNGNAPANASLSDDLSGVFDDATFGEDVTADLGTAQVTADHLDWSGTLPVGGTATITYSVTVHDQSELEKGGDANLRNVVTSDGCTSTNDCTTDHLVGWFTFSKTSDPASGTEVSIGDTIHYTLTIDQHGPGAIDDARLTDDLSDVLDDASWDGVTASDGTAERVTDQLLWSGSLQPGDTETIQYNVIVQGSGNGVINNVVKSDSPAGQCDPLASCATAHTIANDTTGPTNGDGGTTEPTVVDATPATTMGRLAHTGAVVAPWAGAATGLVLLGAALIGLRRRRADTSEQ